MRIALILLLVLASASRMFSGVVPLTAKEIGLMLRSGYSNEAVMQELSKRHFADAFDAEVEKKLAAAGANASLLDGLRTGAYSASATEIAAAKEKLAREQARAAEGAGADEQPDEAQGPARTDVAKTQPKRSAAAARPNDIVYRLLRGSLVYWHNGVLSRFDDETLEHKKLYLFFFSSNKSKPGRQFTPQLVDYYNRVTPQHPELEVVFFSADTSPFAMETYIAQTNMPWPAVAYDQIAARAQGIQEKHVHGVPSLILIDATGNILSNSGSDENHPSLEKVLVDLDKIFAGNGAGVAGLTH